MKKIILLCITLILLSCGKKVPESEKDFNEIMASIQQNSYKDLKNNIEKANLYFYKEHLKKIEYKIVEVNEKNGKSTIKVIIKSPDLKSYVPEITERAKTNPTGRDSFEFMNESFLEVLKNKDLRYIEEEVEVKLRRKDQWYLEPDNKKFWHIILGKL